MLSYHDLLFLGVGYDIDDNMAVVDYFDNGFHETHYIAVVFPNGDELHRFENAGGVPYSAIYTHNKDGNLEEMISHERKKELGLVIHYLESCLANGGHYWNKEG